MKKNPNNQHHHRQYPRTSQGHWLYSSVKGSGILLKSTGIFKCGGHCRAAAALSVLPMLENNLTQ